MTVVLSTECLLLPIQKWYQTQRIVIVKQSGKKSLFVFISESKKKPKLRKKALFESKTLKFFI